MKLIWPGVIPVGVVKYELLRTVGGALSTIPISPINNVLPTYYEDKKVSFGYMYSYQVRAYDAAGNHSAWTSVVNADLVTDSDGDGFPNELEGVIGTSSTLACGTNAWPVDMNNDKQVNSLDLQVWTSTYSGKNRNSDLNNDGKVNILDTAIWKSKFIRGDLNGDGLNDSKDQNIIAASFLKRCS